MFMFIGVNFWNEKNQMEKENDTTHLRLYFVYSFISSFVVFDDRVSHNLILFYHLDGT